MSDQIKLVSKDTGEGVVVDFDVYSEMLNGSYGGSVDSLLQSFDVFPYDESEEDGENSTDEYSAPAESTKPAKPAKPSKTTYSDRKKFMQDMFAGTFYDKMPFDAGAVVANEFPYIIDEYMRKGDKGVLPSGNMAVAGMKDLLSLPGRWLYPFEKTGVTGEESQSTMGKMLKDPMVLPSIASGSALGAAAKAGASALTLTDMNALLGGALGYTQSAIEQPGYGTDNGSKNENNAAMGFLLGLLPDAAISAYKAFKDRAAREVVTPVERGVVNESTRGPRDVKKMMEDKDTDLRKAANAERVDKVMRNLDEPNRNALENETREKVDKIKSMETPVGNVGEGLFKPVVSKSYNQLGRNLSDKELGLIESIGLAKEEKERLIALAERKKEEGANVLSEIQNAIDTINKQYDNAISYNRRSIDLDAMPKEENAGYFIDFANNEGNFANYLGKSSIEDIQRNETQYRETLRLIDEAEDRLKYVNERIAEKYNGGNSSGVEALENEREKLNKLLSNKYKEEAALKKFIEEDNRLLSSDPRIKAQFAKSRLYEMLSDSFAGEASAIREKGASKMGEILDAQRRATEGLETNKYWTGKDIASENERIANEVAEKSSEIKTMRDALKNSKGDRHFNAENGMDMLVFDESPEAQYIHTDKRSEEFSDKLRKNLMNYEDLANARTLEPNGAKKQSARLENIPPDVQRDMIRSKPVYDTFYEGLMARARSKSRGIETLEPVVYYEDVVFALEKVLEKNNIHMAKAVLDAADWIPPEIKKDALNEVALEKMVVNLREFDPEKFYKDGIGFGSTKLGKFLDRWSLNGLKIDALKPKKLTNDEVVKRYKRLKDFNAKKYYGWKGGVIQGANENIRKAVEED